MPSGGVHPITPIPPIIEPRMEGDSEASPALGLVGDERLLRDDIGG